MRIKAAHTCHVTKRKLVDEFSLEESNAKLEKSNSSEAPKYQSLITVKSEPNESTSPVTDIVSPKKTTPTKVQTVKTPEKLDTPRKSPTISQNVANEAALPAKLVMPEIDLDKICDRSKKKESKEYFTVMYVGKPLKIYVVPEGGSDSEGPVDQSSAKETSDKSEENLEDKDNVPEKLNEVKDFLSSSNDISGEKWELIEMMNKTSDEVSFIDTEANSNSDEQSENEQKEKCGDMCETNEENKQDNGEEIEGEKSQEETEDSEEDSSDSSDERDEKDKQDEKVEINTLTSVSGSSSSGEESNGMF